MMAPATALAVRYSPGGTAGASGGARLPPLKNAASPAHPAAVPRSAAWAAAMAARRFSSFGSAIQRSVACSDALIFGAGSGPAARRAETQAHQTASRLGSACARKRTASAYSFLPANSLMKSTGGTSGRSIAMASSPNSATVLMTTTFGIGCGASPISVDHDDAALLLEHGGALDLGHQSLHLHLDLTVDLDHH